MTIFSFWFGIFVGALAIVTVEVWILAAIVRRIGRRLERSEPADSKGVRDLDGEQSLSSLLNKQGVVWVLEPEKVPKFVANELQIESKELKQKKLTIVEVNPVKIYAKIKDRSLVLSCPDGAQTTIELLDCTVSSVSASDFPSRKWAKRYPIRLESKNSKLYKESKTCYIYFETSWDKESWCKALRIAAFPDKVKLNWFAQLSDEFHSYIMSLASQYPSFLKPPALLSEVPDKMDRIDASSSKVQDFLKKLAKNKNLAKRASKNRIDASSSTGGSVKSSSENSSNNSLHDLAQSTPTIQSSFPTIPDSVRNENSVTDEGTLCWNLLFSRLFFDAKRSNELNNGIKARIQRSLSNMRTPGYIGGVTCTSLDLGDLPPIIHNMKVLPMDLNEVWAVEVDIEYSGGIVLDVETRIEVYEQERDDVDKTVGLSSDGKLTLGILDDVDYHEIPSRVSSNSADQSEIRNEGDKVDSLTQSKKWASNYATRWKAAVHSIANKVSQVPLSLAIRIVSLRGTLRLHIKSPPSDQLWFGFTTMPEIEWDLDSSVGDQRITSSSIGLLFSNRFKASLRENLVLPNCENICIPWMLAEKDDWVPRNVAPFIWTNQEAMDITGSDSTSSQSGEFKPKLDGSSTRSKTDDISNHRNDKVEKVKNATDSQISDSLQSSKSEEMKEPLLKNDEILENHSRSVAETPMASSSSGESLALDRATPPVEDVKPKKAGGRRARMLDLGKKMGEKLEEKRRLIEERGRLVVEKMRENART